jgi:uncharacterized membrane protein YwzB
MSTLCVIVGLVVILAALWALQRFLYKKMRILSNPEKHPPRGKAGKAPD